MVDLFLIVVSEPVDYFVKGLVEFAVGLLQLIENYFVELQPSFYLFVVIQEQVGYCFAE